MSHDSILVAFLWHMHQPLYIDPFDGEILLPFVRLHAVKDYYEMLMISNSFDELFINYNLVPSLLDQILLYSGKKRETNEKWLKLTVRNPSEMSQAEKLFIINNFFLGNPEHMIQTLPYFNTLYHKALRTTKSSRDSSTIVNSFNDQELLDIQVLHSISWLGEYSRKNNSELNELIKKEKNYNEGDKQFIIDFQFSIMESLIDHYREAEKLGKIEISTTPYYHPILPLLINSDSGKISSDKPLPARAFRFPKDAEYQIIKAKERMSQLFNKESWGFWPSEGSLSDETLDIFARHDINWVATDEGNLYKSKYSIENKYFCPYLFESKHTRHVPIFFRNHYLSDKIGFVYSRWDASSAVDDMISHIKKVSQLSKHKNPVIPIILDGENCWEYYKMNGYMFLNELYSRLCREKNIRTITFSSYLASFQREDYKIFSLNPGSWINDNFDIWIGNHEENKAWDYLREAREITSPENPGYDNILIAEGSDWFWWYGDQHQTSYSKIFDRLFRRNLQKFYSENNTESPSSLNKPIKRKTSYRLYQQPKILIDPIIDGKITNFYEWLNAGFINVSDDFGLGSLHQRNIMINKIFYGFNKNRAFLMAVFSNDFSNEIEKIRLSLILEEDQVCSLAFEKNRAVLQSKARCDIVFAYEDILELSIPIRLNQEYFTFRLSVEEKDSGSVLENYPIEGFYKIKIPSFVDYADFWYV